MTRLKKHLPLLACAAVSLLFMLYGADKGVDINDTGYLLAQYRDIAEGYGEPVFGTLLSSYVGALVSMLFPSHALIAHRVLVAVTFVLIGVMGYFTVRRYLPEPMALAAAFCGVFFGRMYSFVVGYNSLSALLCTACAVLIMLALRRDSRVSLVCAGLLLTPAVGARLPNALMAAFVLAVWWYYAFSDGWRKALGRSALFLASFAAPFIIIIALVALFNADALGALVSQASGYAVRAFGSDDSHNLASTGLTLISHNLCGVRNLVLLIAPPCAAAWLARRHPIRRHAKTLFILYGLAISVAGVALFGIYSGPRSDFTGNTSLTWSIIYALSALTLTLSCVCAVRYRRSDPLFSSFGVLCGVLAVCFPLGTDTGVISLASVCVLPACFCSAAVYRLGKELRRPLICDGAWSICSLMLCIGLVFSVTYAYSDSTMPTLDAEVEHAPILSVKTTPEKADELEYFLEIIEPYESSGRELIVSGRLPILHALTDMHPFFGSAWQDLDSYSLERYTSALDSADENPVIIINLRSTYSTVWPETSLWDYGADKKHSALIDFMDENGYELISSDGVLELWLPADMIK